MIVCYHKKPYFYHYIQQQNATSLYSCNFDKSVPIFDILHYSYGFYILQSTMVM